MEQNNLTNKNEEKVEPLETEGEQISDNEKPKRDIDRDMHDIEVEVGEYARTFDTKMKALQEKGLSFEEAAKLMYEEWIKNDPGGQNYIRILNLYKDQIEPDEEIKKENKKKIDILNQELVKNKEEETELKNRLEKENLTEEEYLETKSKLEENLAQSLKLEDELSHADYVAPWETRVRQKMQELEDKERRLKAKIDSTTKAIDEINQSLGLANIEPSKIPSLNKISKKLGFNKIFKSVLVAGLMMGATSEGLSQNKSEKDSEKEHKEWVEKQYQLYKKGALKEGSKVKAPDGSVYVIGPLKIENLKGQEEIKSINISSYFKTGTVEFVDAKAEENAKQSIRDFLITVGGLENSTIKVIGSYSKDKPWGNVSAQHPYGDKNTDLANKRKEVCRSLFENVLKETYSEDYIKNLSIEEISKGIGLSDNLPEDEIKKMSDLERNKKINSYQGMSIEIIKKIIKEPETLEKLTLNKEEMEFLNTIIVVVDESNSMVRDAKKVKSIVEKVNKYNKEKNNKSIEIKKLEGGNKEAHIQTLKNILLKLDDTYQGKEILVITDEPDENFDSNSYDIAMGEVLKLSQEKGVKVVFKIFNPDESKSGSVSVVLDKTTIGVLKKPEKLNRKYFTVDDLKKAWYEGLVANSNSLTSN